MTNGDKLRQRLCKMDDAELAEFLGFGCMPDVIDGEPDTYRCSKYHEVTEDGVVYKHSCHKCWYDWIKQEAKDD